MRKLLSVSVVTFALLACTSDRGSGRNAERDSAQPPVATDGNQDKSRWVVRPESFGLVRFGAPLPAVSSAIGEEVRPGYADFETCDYVRPKALTAATSLMVISDTIMRVEPELHRECRRARHGLGHL